MKLRHAALTLLALAMPAYGQTADFYLLKDASSPQKQLQMKVFTTGGITSPVSISSDASGNPLSGIAGTTNPNGTGLFVQGLTGGVPVPVSGNITCSNCSGSGVSVNFAGSIGSVGTPGGFKDGSGNFQPLLGDVANGQWVNIKASVSIPVTGTFWPYTLGQQLAAASVPVVLTAAQITALTPPTSVGISGTLPAFAATPTVNLGTIGGAATQTTLASVLSALGSPMQNSGGSLTANAGTNLNTSLLALESGGHLASIDTKTPALGQALAAGSVPVVLTAAQITTLTPPAAITGFALDASVGTTNTDLGAPGATACATDTGSCSLNALAQRLAQRLTTINTTLGTPFQAGGSIGNTSFGATQATAANLNATVVGTGTFAVQAAQSGAWNITNISGTVSLPTGAATSALQPTNAAIASTTSGQTGHLMMGAVTTGAPTYTTAQTNPLSLTTAGALRVDGSGVTQPVSLTSTTITGTVAVTQSGSWSLAANQSVNEAQINGVTPLMGNGVTGTGSQRVTIASDNTAFSVNAIQSGTWNINNIAGTISLPTGAATAAKQPALGTAGAPSADVITVQGAASMTALKVDGSAVTQPISAASLPLPALAATSTKQSDGTQKTQVVDGSGNVQPAGDTAARAINQKVTDGTNTAAVKAASTAPAATDASLVVANSPNAGNSVIASTPPSYSASQFKYQTSLLDGSAVTNGPSYIGPLTCSSSGTCAALWASTQVWPYNTLRLQFITATGASGIQVQCSLDGTNFVALTGHWDNNPLSFVQTPVLAGSYLYNINGFKFCKVTTSFYTASDTLSIAIGLSTGPADGFIKGTVTATASDVNGNSTIPPTATATTASSLASGSLFFLYKFEATAPTTADHLLILDAASLPANGTVTPKKCYPTAGAGALTQDSWIPGPPLGFSTGIVIAYSTGGSCYTLTAATTTGNPYISMEAR